MRIVKLKVRPMRLFLESGGDKRSNQPQARQEPGSCCLKPRPVTRAVQLTLLVHWERLFAGVLRRLTLPNSALNRMSCYNQMRPKSSLLVVRILSTIDLPGTWTIQCPEITLVHACAYCVMQYMIMPNGLWFVRRTIVFPDASCNLSVVFVPASALEKQNHTKPWSR